MSVRTLQRLYGLTRRYATHDEALAYVKARGELHYVSADVIERELGVIRARDYPEDFA